MIDATKLPTVPVDPATFVTNDQQKSGAETGYARAPAGPGYAPAARPGATQRNSR